MSIESWHAVVIECRDCKPTIKRHGTGATILRTKTFRHDAASYAEMHGAKRGKVVLLKSVNPDTRCDFRTGTVKYEGIVTAPDWDANPDIQCGNGLHLSATLPELRRWQSNGLVLRCEVAVKDIAVYPGDTSKVRCRQVKVLGPLEVPA